MRPTAIVDAQIEAYNAQNLDAFCACYSDDAVIANLGGEVTEQGAAALRARYARMFAKFPKNKARIVNRIVLGDRIIDHEDVTRGPGGPRFEAVAIYTVTKGKIARVDFIK